MLQDASVRFLAQAGSTGEVPWVTLIISLVLIACVVAVSLMGSKRTHQD